jgi:hypothetical protein
MCVYCAWASITPCTADLHNTCGFTADVGFDVVSYPEDGAAKLSFGIDINGGVVLWEKLVESFDCSTLVTFTGSDIIRSPSELACSFANATVVFTPAENPC